MRKCYEGSPEWCDETWTGKMRISQSRCKHYMTLCFQPISYDFGIQLIIAVLFVIIIIAVVINITHIPCLYVLLLQWAFENLIDGAPKISIDCVLVTCLEQLRICAPWLLPAYLVSDLESEQFLQRASHILGSTDALTLSDSLESFWYYCSVS